MFEPFRDIEENTPLYKEMKAHPIAARVLEEVVARKKEQEKRALRKKKRDKHRSEAL